MEFRGLHLNPNPLIYEDINIMANKTASSKKGQTPRQSAAKRKEIAILICTVRGEDKADHGAYLDTFKGSELQDELTLAVSERKAKAGKGKLSKTAQANAETKAANKFVAKVDKVQRSAKGQRQALVTSDIAALVQSFGRTADGATDEMTRVDRLLGFDLGAKPINVMNAKGDKVLKVAWNIKACSNLKHKVYTKAGELKKVDGKQVYTRELGTVSTYILDTRAAMVAKGKEDSTYNVHDAIRNFNTRIAKVCLKRDIDKIAFQGAGIEQEPTYLRVYDKEKTLTPFDKALSTLVSTHIDADPTSVQGLVDEMRRVASKLVASLKVAKAA